MGTIGGSTGTSASAWSNGVNPPTPVLVSSEFEHDAMNRMPLSERRPPSPSEYPPQSLANGTQEVVSGSGATILKSNALAYHSPIPYQPPAEKLPDVMPAREHDFRNEGVTRFSDFGVGYGGTTAGTNNDGSQCLDKRKRAITPDEGRKMRRSLPDLQIAPLAMEPPTTTPPSNWHMISQRIYRSKQKQRHFEHSEPIFFSVNGFPGVKMGEALRNNFTGLDGRDDLVLNKYHGQSRAILCRLLVR